MRCVRARPSLATRWRRAHRGRSSEGCSCPYLFRWRSLREEWSCGAWWCSFPDKPPAHSENRWGRERGRSIPFSEVAKRSDYVCSWGTSGRNVLAASTTGFDPNVWTRRALQEKTMSLESTVLHQCIRPRVGVHAPDHHGNPRASDLITGHASEGYWGHQFSDALERPFLHLFYFSRRPRLAKRVSLPRCLSW